MAAKSKRLELNCLVCSKPLTSTQSCLNEDALNLIAEQNVIMRNKLEIPDYNRYNKIDQEQTVATKCGHMFHMGCLRSHIKGALESKSGHLTPNCPMCKKPVTLTRVWPVLIPPTPAQLSRMKKIHEMKIQNNELKLELAEIRDRIREGELELDQTEKDTTACLEAIGRKQKILEALNGPTDEEIEQLRKVHQKRQLIVRTVTKHNAELLGVLMHETNIQPSDLKSSRANILSQRQF